MEAAGSSSYGELQGKATRAGRRKLVAIDTLRAAVLALVALDIGWTNNGARRDPLDLLYRSPKARLSGVPDSAGLPAGPKSSAPASLDLEAFQTFVAAQQGLVVDARAPDFYRSGHVPGAINLPRESFAAAFEAQRPLLERARAGQVAVYCADTDCADAELVATELSRLGFQRVGVFQGGWDEWTRAGLREEGWKSP